jgi:hypothetical protein
VALRRLTGHNDDNTAVLVSGAVRLNSYAKHHSMDGQTHLLGVKEREETERTFISVILLLAMSHYILGVNYRRITKSCIKG